MRRPLPLTPETGDALLVVDVQNDFLPGGSLGVAQGDEVVPVLNRYIELFRSEGLPVYATRDWHPMDHCSFQPQGGPWPPHCIAGTEGAAFAAGLALPTDVVVVSKATRVDQDAYSGFEGTNLAARLHAEGIRRLFIGGLATDYCVLNTVKDALAGAFEVVVLHDAIRAVNLHPDDGARAEEEMQRLGSKSATYAAIAAS